MPRVANTSHHLRFSRPAGADEDEDDLPHMGMPHHGEAIVHQGQHGNEAVNEAPQEPDSDEESETGSDESVQGQEDNLHEVLNPAAEANAAQQVGADAENDIPNQAGVIVNPHPLAEDVDALIFEEQVEDPVEHPGA